MKLTKERAIAEYRKMWLWISKQIMKDYLANRTIRTVFLYKMKYMNKVYPNEMIECNCFCCEYVEQSGKNCEEDCPLYWNDKHTKRTCGERNSYYNIIYNNSICCTCTFKEAKRMARMAYKIAILEEKEITNKGEKYEKN